MSRPRRTFFGAEMPPTAASCPAKVSPTCAPHDPRRHPPRRPARPGRQPATVLLGAALLSVGALLASASEA
jgi:hypothetical protein